jgi:hypothetical protein
MPGTAPPLCYSWFWGTYRPPTSLFSLRSAELNQGLFMQDPNLSQVALRFLNVMPYGVQLVPDCNLAGMIQRSLKSLDAKCGKSDKGISLLYSFCWLTWLPPSSLPEPGV